MFTVCPKCALTLVVTAADLRAAQGYVRCGRCSNVFNALARLVEDRASAAAIQASPPPAPPEQPQAELEADKTQLAQAQESQAEELEAGETQVEEPEVEETRIEVIEAEETQAEEVQAEEGDEPIPEGALEFNPEATDVSKVFIEATPTPQWTAATGSFKALILKSDETPPAQPPQEVAWPQEALQGQEKEKEPAAADRKSTRLNSSHRCISYAVFCLKKKKKNTNSFTTFKQRKIMQSFLTMNGSCTRCRNRTIF